MAAHNHSHHHPDDHSHSHPIKPYDITSKELDNSKVEINASISWEDLSKYRSKALKKLQENVSLPGFRRGHVPEHVLLAHVGEMSLLNDMAEMALEDAYPFILERELLHPIDFPSITITKMAPENPLEFKMELEVYPTITLGDYKKIAKREMLVEEPAVALEKEIEDAYTELLKRAGYQGGEISKELLSQFEVDTTEELKKKVTKEMQEEKNRQAKEKKRSKILQEIIKESGMPIPSRFIEEELNTMLAQFQGDLGNMGYKFSDYLSRIKKTEADLRNEWRKDAEERVKFHLTLAKIAQEEKITPEEEEVKKELVHMKEHHQNVPEEQLRNFVERILRNEKVFQFLEAQK